MYDIIIKHARTHVHTLWVVLPVVLASFVERAVGPQTAESPTETREAEREEEEDHRKDEEEDDEQRHSDRIRL